MQMIPKNDCMPHNFLKMQSKNYIISFYIPRNTFLCIYNEHIWVKVKKKKCKCIHQVTGSTSFIKLWQFQYTILADIYYMLYCKNDTSQSGQQIIILSCV